MYVCIVVVDTRLQDVRRLLGERLRRYRESLGISVQRLANAAGVSRQYVHLVEKGGANLTIDTYVNMLAACGVSFNDFLRGLRSSDIPESHQHAYRCLGEILDSQQEFVITGIVLNLEAISLYARSLKHTRHVPIIDLNSLTEQKSVKKPR